MLWLEAGAAILHFMRQLAPLIVMSLLTSIVGVLVFFGAVHAFEGHATDCGRHASQRTITSGGEASSLPQAYDVMTVTRSDPCAQGECDADFDGECCAVACHSATRGLCLIVLASSEHRLVDELASVTSLHGRLVEPGDRPPRSF